MDKELETMTEQGGSKQGGPEQGNPEQGNPEQGEFKRPCMCRLWTFIQEQYINLAPLQDTPHNFS